MSPSAGPGGVAGRFTPGADSARQKVASPTVREPEGAVEWSRRAVINVVAALGEQARAVTLVGGHAVQIRTANLAVSMLPTSDGDLAVEPSLVVDGVSIGDLLSGAGYVSRTPDRPGLWGRSEYLDANGTRQFREQVDLAVPLALSGTDNPRKRSTPVLSKIHGKMSTTNTPGLELAVKDRDPVEVVDFAEPSLKCTINVAGIPALLVAKAQKVSERMDEPGARRLRAKDLGDLWRLLACGEPEHCRQVIESHLADPDIGPGVAVGLAHLRRVLPEAVSARLACASLDGYVAPDRIAADFRRWEGAFADRPRM